MVEEIKKSKKTFKLGDAILFLQNDQKLLHITDLNTTNTPKNYKQH